MWPDGAVRADVLIGELPGNRGAVFLSISYYLGTIDSKELLSIISSHLKNVHSCSEQESACYNHPSLYLYLRRSVGRNCDECDVSRVVAGRAGESSCRCPAYGLP